MADGLRCRVAHDTVMQQLHVSILERVNGRTRYILRPDDSGLWRREELTSGGARLAPSLVFDQEEGHEVLRSLAEELAKLGYVQLHDAGQLEALRNHVADMRTQADRLYALASREPK